MSTPIETNTEELQEVLQQVYNLPNRSASGSSTPDLVLTLNVEGRYMDDNNVTKEAFSIKSGSVQSTYTKLKNHEEVKIFVEFLCYYGGANYTGILYPIMVSASDDAYGGDSGVQLKFLSDYVPGYNGSVEQISLWLKLDGTIYNFEMENLHY